jgi:ABC-type amino acid transport substrate-binding protein
MYFATDGEALMEDFNKYLAEFKKTDEYKDLVKRIDEYDGTEYIGTDIPLTGTGEVLKIAADPNNFPRAFLNPGEEIITGYDVEILKHYANDRNYQLEFSYSTYNDGTIGLQNGMYDIMTGYICDVYKTEAENIGLNVCDKMYDFSLYFLQKNRKDITSNTSALD